MAFSDLLQAVVVLIAASENVTQVNEQILNELAISESDSFDCQLAVGTFMFVYTQATSAVVLLTVDRYLTIAYWGTYVKIMTKKMAAGLILGISWCLPVVMLLGGVFCTKH